MNNETQEKYIRVGYDMVQIIEDLCRAFNDGRYKKNKTGDKIDEATSLQVDKLVAYVKENY